MNRAVKIAAIVALLAFASLCVGALLTVLQVREATVDISNRVDRLSDGLTARVEEAKQPLALTAKVLSDARLTVDNVNRAAIDERFYFEQEVPGTMRRVNAAIEGLGGVEASTRDLLAGLHETAAAATLTLDTTTDNLRGLQPIERKAGVTLDDVDAVIANPNIPLLLAHGDDAAAATASAAHHLDGTAADTEDAVHRFLHPTWAARVTNWMGQAAHAAGGWF